MGMSYQELDEYGKLRVMSRNGPLTMFENLLIKSFLTSFFIDIETPMLKLYEAGTNLQLTLQKKQYFLC